MRNGRNAQRILGASLICAITLGTSILLYPQAARAFSLWPFSFSDTASASSVAVQHDASIPLLQAAGNPDPNPFKGSQDITTTEGSALIAQSGIDGSVGETLYKPDSDSISTYIVRNGDTLSEIASMFSVSNNTVLWANNLKSAKDVKPGMTLLILPVSGISHTVTKGETLAGLAKKFGADPDEVATFNGLADGAALVVGMKIVIPGGELAVASATTVKKATASAKSPSAPRGLAGAGGRDLGDFWSNPLPGAILTQGIHDANGVDLGAKVGTPILAAGPGKVIFVSTNGSYNHGWGNDVIIDHGNGAQTLYAHMSTVIATVGQSVSGGDKIGAVGMTGSTTGPHLHLEVRGARNPFASCSLRKACSI